MMTPNAHNLAVIYTKAVRSVGLSKAQFALVASEIATFADFDLKDVTETFFQNLLSKVKIQKETKSLLQVLSANKRLSILPQLAEALKADFLKAENTRLVRVRSFEPLEAKEVEEIKGAFLSVLKGDVVVEGKLDKSLLGGYVISFDSKELDFSKKSKLAKIQTCILS